MKQIIQFLILLLFGINVLPAQSTVGFNHIDNEDGLSGNSVLTILQDYEGFMWFGTRYGLNRYDGYEIVNYYSIPNNTNTINNNHVNKIFEDSNNNLWILTNNGISKYDRLNDVFTRVVINDNNSFITNNIWIDMLEDEQGNMYLLNPDYFVKLKSSKTNAVAFEIIEHVNFIDNRAKCMYINKSGMLWIGTKKGVFIFDNDKLTKYNLKLNNINVNYIYPLKNGMLAFATENSGLVLLNEINQSTKVYKYNKNNENSLINNRVRSVFESEKGNIWIGTREGLSIFNQISGKIQNFIHKSINSKSISDNSIKTIYGDNQGGIWLGTYAGGVDYYHKQNSKFEHVKKDFTKQNTISSDKVSYLFKDKQSILWLGTEGRGLNKIDEKNGTIVPYSNYTGYYGAIDNIKSITEGEYPYLWLGTNGGLSRFNRETGEFNNYFHNPLDSNSISHNQIHSVIYDSGTLWIGTNGGGLNKYNINNNKFYSYKKVDNTNGIISNNINYLLKQKNGGIWLGTESGIDFILPDCESFNRSDEFLNFQEKLPVNKIIVLFIDNHNYLWIGTEGRGLFCVNTNSYDYQNITDNIDGFGKIIYGIEQDDDENIWVSTNKGLSKLTIEYSADSISLTRVNNYLKNDGLQGNQFSYRSSLKDEDGKIYFGGIHGYNAFYPKHISETIATPHVIFTNFEINYQKVKANQPNSPLKNDITQTKNITLNYDQQPVSITFAGQNYINPKNTYYSYMLVGADDDWIKSGKQRTLTYTHIKEGDYELRVKASDNNNEWGDNFSSLKIKVLPPYWRTWWAYIIYLLLTFAVISGVLIYSFKWLRLKNKLILEKLSKIKEQELHENKLRFFTDVSHELRTPLTLIISPLEKLVEDSKDSLRFNKEVKAIERNSKKMLLLIDQLLDLRKFEKGHAKLEIAEGNITRFIKETTLPFRELALAKGFAFSFTSSADDISLWFDRAKMEIVIHNLLSNAFKAIITDGNIEVRLSVIENANKKGDQKSFVKIEVEDNGKGIPKKYVDNIFNRFYQLKPNNNKTANSSGIGLELAMRMVKLHNGEINVISNEATKTKLGKTIFTILIPKTTHLQNNAQVAESNLSVNKKETFTTELLMSEYDDFEGDINNNTLEEILDFDTDKPILLVVEDEKEVRDFVAGLFTNNYKVKTAINGKDGWESIIKEIPDIIISDIMMPEIDGLELCRMIKLDKRTSHIPIILLTARTSVTFKYEGMETGADDYISKPFSAKYLAMRVKILLQQRKQIQDHFFRNSIIQPKELGISTLDQTLIKNAIHYIEENIDNPQLSVESLSLHLGLSRVHLYRKLKGITNITAIEFIRNIRLKRAAQLFEAGNHSIKEVRYNVGIGDATNFRSSFKKLYGVNPSEYIKQLSK